MITATNYLAGRVASMEESATIKMAQLSRKMRSEGIDIIDLSLGEPDFTTPAHICEAAKKAIDQGYTHYPPVPGFPELRAAISEKFRRENGLHYSPEQVVVSAGAKQSIANLLLSVINPGDELLLPAPYWVSYAAIARLAEAKIVEIPATIENGFKITPEQLEAGITPKSKAFLFSSPCNPTGAVYTEEELFNLAKVFQKYPGIIIISDEIYEHINYTGHHASIGVFEEVRDRVVTVNGFSKGFAMTGWRVGYMGAPLEIARACEKIQGQFTSGTCAIAQKAGEAALRSPLDATYAMRDAFKKRRDAVYQMLTEIPDITVNLPDGAFYFFIRVNEYFGKKSAEGTITGSEDLSMYLLREGKISVVPGSPFGAPEYIRISYATSEEKLIRAISRLKEALTQLT